MMKYTISQDENIGELAAHKNKSILRFLTCGSVDDGKSTLIGRLLHDTCQIYEDQLSTLYDDSKRFGTQGENIEFSLLVDGLKAEREQGITIDVTYRYFSTKQRKFMIADTPGHEQYTRNMATGASHCDLAILLIDARKGVLDQTCRHSCISTLLGIRHLVVAVNKMDLVEYNYRVFDDIRKKYQIFSEKLKIEDLTIIFVPLSALHGENVACSTTRMPWYCGPTLLEVLETVEVISVNERQPILFPVQYINRRPTHDFRGYSGTLVSGILKLGQSVKVLPSGMISSVLRIVTFDGDLEEARPGEALTIVLEEEIDVSRGDVIVDVDHNRLVEVVNHVLVDVVWMTPTPLVVGHSWYIKIAHKTTRVRVNKIEYQLDINTLVHRVTNKLTMNAIGLVELSFDEPMILSKYRDNRILGGMIFINPLSNATVGAGMVRQPFNTSSTDEKVKNKNIVWQSHPIVQNDRERLHKHRGIVLWFTGLSGSGKSTLAGAIEQTLHQQGASTYLIDGDNIRHGLCRDLGFSDDDRRENMRRIGEVVRCLVDAGLIVLIACISPYRAERKMVRDMFPVGRFIEIFVDTPLVICESRDPKTLYKKARKNKIDHFTGIHSAYETPIQPEIHLHGEQLISDLISHVVYWIRERVWI